MDENNTPSQKKRSSRVDYSRERGANFAPDWGKYFNL